MFLFNLSHALTYVYYYTNVYSIQSNVTSLSVTCHRSVVFSGFSGFLHQLNVLPRYNWNIVESGVKHHQTNVQLNTSNWVRRRPRNTWRRDLIAEMEIEGYRWQDLERMSQNRTRWRTVVSGLYTTKVQQASAAEVSNWVSNHNQIN